jgi:hypothetical protein
VDRRAKAVDFDEHDQAGVATRCPHIVSAARAVQVATAATFSSDFVICWLASRASAVLSFPSHRPPRCCRQGGSIGVGEAMLCAIKSFHETVGKTSVAQVRLTESEPPVVSAIPSF